MALTSTNKHLSTKPVGKWASGHAIRGFSAPLTTVLYKWGVGRGKVVLTEVLGEQFDGIGVTDDMSVLASLSKRMEHFTLGSVLAEINRWIETGQSVFREELASIQAATAPLSKPPP